MIQQDKNKAEKKAELALCKLLDIFYLNPTSRIATRLDKACDAVREVINEIENTTAVKSK